MNKKEFLKHFKKLNEKDYKGINGRITLIGGSYGLAGALGLNIIGALSSGSTYTNVLCDEKVYDLLASRFLRCVFYPVNEFNFKNSLNKLADNKVICFGSGMTNLSYKNKLLDYLLQSFSNKVILDAEAFNILKKEYYKLSLSKSTVVLTPHIKEFSTLIDVPIDKIRKDKRICKNFAVQNKVILILKDTNMTVYGFDGSIYKNKTGNQNLAHAGSGDLLTGMLTHFLSMDNDIYTNIKMALWLFGHMSDLAADKYPTASFNIEYYERLLEDFYLENNL